MISEACPKMLFGGFPFPCYLDPSNNMGYFILVSSTTCRKLWFTWVYNISEGEVINKYTLRRSHRWCFCSKNCSIKVTPDDNSSKSIELFVFTFSVPLQTCTTTKQLQTQEMLWQVYAVIVNKATQSAFHSFEEKLDMESFKWQQEAVDAKCFGKVFVRGKENGCMPRSDMIMADD